MQKRVSKIKSLKGEITIPSDKSISHRAIMLSSLANGKTIIKNFSSATDCRSTLNIFKQLGVEINELDNKVVEISSNGQLHKSLQPLNAENSGTTIRLVTGILAGQNFESEIIGDESLSRRPMRRILEPLTQMGANIHSVDGHAPLTIRGQKLHGIIYNSPIASAQVKSSILLAGLNAEGATTIKEPWTSRNHTELMLKYLGADIITYGTEVTVLPSTLIAKDIEVVGDISSAAFFITAGLIVPKSDIVIKNVGINPTRTGILDIIKKMGAAQNIKILDMREISGEKCADIGVTHCETLRGCEIGGAEIPRLIDELPIIAVLASCAEGDTIVKDAGDLRNKETDRITCLVSELKKIGVNIEETFDGFIVHGKSKLLGGAKLQTFNDHRLAMSFYIAGLLCEQEVLIDGFEWIRISFPEFEELITKIEQI